MCVSGECEAAALCEGVTCEDTECRTNGMCDPNDGKCDYTLVENGTACSGGACLDGAPDLPGLEVRGDQSPT